MKFPKINHFPWSENVKDDDRVMHDYSVFDGRDIVVTIKMDGENTGCSRNRCHARSEDSRDHVSRHWMKQLWGGFAHDIPEDFEIFGENVFALHSIPYTDLPSYFFLFGIFKDKLYLSWAEVKEWAALLGLQTAPELYCGPWNEEIVRQCYTGKCEFGEQEGYVVRLADGFSVEQFTTSIVKMVRSDHIKTDQNWMYQPVVPNKLRS